MKSELSVFTFAGGAFSKLGHDLLFALPAEILVAGKSDWAFDAISAEDPIHVEAQLSCLRLVGACAGGRVDPNALSAKDRQKIETAARLQVLKTDQYPCAIFRGRWCDGSLSGALEMAGAKREVEMKLEPVGMPTPELRGELKPSLWGIESYRALLGALRVEDRVRIEWRLP